MMHRSKKTALLATILSSALCASAALKSGPYVAINASSGDVRPGEWNADFAAVTNYASMHHVPAIVVFSNPLGSCGACERFQTACSTKEFLDWQKQRGLAMAFSKIPKAQNFSKPENGPYQNGTPFICVWWPKEDGTISKNSFSGVMNKMPSQVGDTLAAQAINSMELFLCDYAASGASNVRRYSLPLYAVGDGARKMAGRIDIREFQNGSFSAKVLGGAGNASTSPCGRWYRGIDAASADLSSSDGSKVEIKRTDKGGMTAKLVEPAAGAEFESGEFAPSDPVAYAGFYNVIFSDAKQPGSRCCGFMQMAITPDGAAKWHGSLCSGRMFTGACTIGSESNGMAIIPIFDPVAGFSASLAVRRGMAARASTGDCRAVKIAPGTTGRISHSGSFLECKAWGSFISREVNLESIADDGYASTTLGISFGNARFNADGSSAVDAALLPTGRVSVAETGMALVDKTGIDSFVYIPSRGAFRGTASVRLADGTTSPVGYRGVVIPGWHDCGCDENLLKATTPFHIEHARPDADPFAAGGAWFGRSADCASGPWRFTVRID